MKKLIFLLPFILIENIYSKDLNIMPVENNEVIYQEVVNLNGSYSDEDVFEAVKSFLSENNLHRKTDAGYSTGMALVGGVTISPTMSIVEANNRNRKTLVSASSIETSWKKKLDQIKERISYTTFVFTENW